MSYTPIIYLKKIPQFDFITLNVQITGLFIGLFSFYYYTVNLMIPTVLGINKLRVKKHSQNTATKIAKNKESSKFLKLVNYKLKEFINV